MDFLKSYLDFLSYSFTGTGFISAVTFFGVILVIWLVTKKK